MAEGLYVAYMNTDGADHSDFSERVKASRSEKGFNGGTHKFWLYWEYCNVPGKKERIDFKTPNDALFAMCDAETRKELVHFCAEKIKQFLAEK